MKVSLNQDDKDSLIQRVMSDNGVCIGSVILDISGFYYFMDNGKSGWYEAHLLRQIADILDGLNAPIEASLKEYFDNLPKEIDTAPKQDDMPF